MRTSAGSWKPEGASLESCASGSSAHGTARTEAQRLGLLFCLATSNFQRIFGGPCQDASGSPAPKIRTSAGRWQPEGSILQSCCSASSAHGTARTEAQRLELLACLANANFKRMLGMGVFPNSLPPAALLRKCERLQIADRQKGLAWKAVAQHHLPMALLAQRHRDRGCLLVLPPPTSNAAWECGWSLQGSLRQPCSENVNVCR